MNTRHVVDRSAPAALVVVLLLLLTRCTLSTADDDSIAQQQARQLYYPQAYAQADVDDFLKNGGRRLDYTTQQGMQTAWLIAPAKKMKVERLWVVCAGNATLALDLASFCKSTGLTTDAFVLIDYPGYGFCQGDPGPDTIRENVKTATLAAANAVGIDIRKNPQDVCVLGHSLGCATALLAVEEFHLKAAVLCAPFTSSREMAELKFGLPVGAPFYQQFDNRLALKELLANHGHAWIIHGKLDEIIPVQMSQTLASEFKSVVKLQIADTAHHNDLMRAARDQIIDAMKQARLPVKR